MHAAMDKRNLEELKASIASARDAMGSEALISDGEALVGMLVAEAKRRAVAEDALRDAILSDDVGGLRSCIDAARQQDASAALITEAEKTLKVILTERIRRPRLGGRLQQRAPCE